MEKLVYRPAEAQAALGIKSSKFWAMVRDGLIETRKMGGTTVIPADSLKRLVDGLPSAKSCKTQAA